MKLDAPSGQELDLVECGDGDRCRPIAPFYDVTYHGDSFVPFELYASSENVR